MKRMRSFVFVLLSILGLGIAACSLEDSQPVAMGELDSLNLLTMDSTAFHLTKADVRNSYLAIVFNPWCEHCQAEAEEIRNNIGKLQDVTIIMIGSVTLKEISDFSERYQLDNFKNMKFAYASPVVTYEKLGAVYLPHLRLYDKDFKMIQEFTSPTTVATILSHIKK